MVNLDPISILSGLPGWLALMLTVFLLQERRRARKLLETTERVRQGRRNAMKQIRNFVKEVSRLAPAEADGRARSSRSRRQSHQPQERDSELGMPRYTGES